jgi:hypothetical protein
MIVTIASFKGGVGMILLIAIVYSCAIFQGTEIQNKQLQKYVSRRQ